MIDNMPYVIAVDGIDAAGKATVCKTLYNYITTHITMNNGFHTTGCRIHDFPDYNTLLGQSIRGLLGFEDCVEVLPKLFAYERSVRRLKFDESSWVHIFNRYYMSNLAYHYNGDITRLQWLEDLEKDSYKCDIVFILDVPSDISNQRRPERRDKLEADLSNLEKIRQNYLELAKMYGWIVLDGTLNPHGVVNDMVYHLERVNRGLSFKDRESP